MQKFKIRFGIDGKVTEQIVTANTAYDAKKIIEAQYSNCKIVWYACTYAD